MNFRRSKSYDPLGALPPSRHPFQVWVLVSCLVTGWVYLVRQPDTAFNRDFPLSINTIWALTLIIGGTVALVSAWWSDRLVGLLLERTALVSLGVAFIVYGGVLIYTFGDIAVQSGSLTLGAGVASLWRSRHVSLELKRLIRLVNSSSLGE